MESQDCGQHFAVEEEGVSLHGVEIQEALCAAHAEKHSPFPLTQTKQPLAGLTKHSAIPSASSHR